MKRNVGRILKQTMTPYGTAFLVRMPCECGHPDCTGVKDQIMLPQNTAHLSREEKADLDDSLAREWNLKPESKVDDPGFGEIEVFILQANVN